MIARAARGRLLSGSLAATFAYLTIHSLETGEHPVYTLLYALLTLEYLAALTRK